MIVELVGGPMDGGWDTIRDDRAEVGSVHEFAFPPVEEYLEQLPPDFFDPTVVVETHPLFYRLASIGKDRVHSQFGRMEFIP